jgi:glucose-6-phosphate isomerase, archaeal
MQIDLTERSGLPISLDLETGELTATGDVDLGEQGERRLSQLRDVLADPDAATDDRICYRTYRGVGTKSDLELLEKQVLRYDITVTLPGLIGREFMKTAGHYHSTAPDGVVYPEIYEVLHGEAVFIMQLGGDSEPTEPVYVHDWFQACAQGEAVVIPPGWGHVTINVGDEPLVVSDLIASSCANDYNTFRSARGAVTYYGRDGDRPWFKTNANYIKQPLTNVPEGYRGPIVIRYEAPLIERFRCNPQRYRWLTNPSEFAVRFWNRDPEVPA